MDNFWLVIAVRHGLPAFLFLAAGILIIMHRVGRLSISDPETVACRKGFLITLGGLIFAGVTVHFWNHILAIFMFLVGSGVWMLNREANNGPTLPSLTVSRGKTSAAGHLVVAFEDAQNVPF